MKYRIHRTVDELNSLGTEWNTLLSRSRSDTIFLTWQWISTWLAVQKPAPPLFVISVRDRANRLLGIAPFYKCKYRLLGMIPIRCLRTIGDNDSAAEYGNFIVIDESEQDVLKQLMLALQETRREWDFLWLHHFASWASGPQTAIKSIRCSALNIRHKPKLFSYISLPESFSAFLAGASANRRRSIRQADRDILQQNTTQVSEPVDETGLAKALSTLLHLHQKRWGHLGQRGSFARLPLLGEFYEAFSSLALQNGWLKFYVLTIDGKAVAAQYGFLYNGTFLQILEGFDPDCPNGAGTALRSHVIKDLCELGVSEYDFLAGSSAHKQRWGASERTGCDLFVTNTRIASRILHAVPVWPTGRFLKQRPHSS